nr:hypothetical protein [Tanacetum cinerariifolium]
MKHPWPSSKFKETSGYIDDVIDLLRYHAPSVLDDHRLLFRLQNRGSIYVCFSIQVSPSLLLFVKLQEGPVGAAIHSSQAMHYKAKRLDEMTHDLRQSYQRTKRPCSSRLHLRV